METVAKGFGTKLSNGRSEQVAAGDFVKSQEYIFLYAVCPLFLCQCFVKEGNFLHVQFSQCCGQTPWNLRNCILAARGI
jgi:hypothetical protein